LLGVLHSKGGVASDAREGGNRSGGRVAQGPVLEPVTAFGATQEGKTQRENPHPAALPPRLAWIYAAGERGGEFSLDTYHYLDIMAKDKRPANAIAG
jgi:hypothetical protein